MTEIPDNPVTQNDLACWYKMHKDLKVLKAAEIALRKKIFTGCFPNPVEGTNNYELADDYILKCAYTLTREIDQGALDAIADKLREQKVTVEKLVAYKPALVKRAYNMLTEEQRTLFDQCLVIKPGSPSLDIILPAKKGKV